MGLSPENYTFMTMYRLLIKFVRKASSKKEKLYVCSVTCGGLHRNKKECKIKCTLYKIISQIIQA